MEQAKCVASVVAMKHNKFTVTLFFFDGFSSTRDLIDKFELDRYMTDGFNMDLVRNVQIIHHPHPES